jgi:hypothetical protein
MNGHRNIKFHVLDPVELNPNYEFITLVLHKIGLKAGIKRYRMDSDESATMGLEFCDV